MYTLGINSAYHEMAACLVKDGRILAAVEEERFNRCKHGKSARIDNADQLPIHAIQYCLDSAGIPATAVDQIGFSLDPQTRLLNKDIKDVVVENDWGSWAGEQRLYEALHRVPNKLNDLGFTGEFFFLKHPLCHAASAFYPSPFDETAVLSIDGIGETSSTLLAHGQDRSIEVLQETHYPSSLGFLWEKFSQFLGFTEYDASKVMGLATYGETDRFRDAFTQLVQPAEEGQFVVDNDILSFRSNSFDRLTALLNVPRRKRGDALTAVHADIAAGLQEITNRIVMHIVNHLYMRTGSTNLCMAGGVALNCVTNQFVYEQGPFSNFYIQPAAHDAGTAMGAALLLWHQHNEGKRTSDLDHVYLGPSYSDEEIEQVLIQGGYRYERLENIEAIVAQLLTQNKVIGWFQGRMEFGPRALGNRSLLASPQNPEMRQILNDRVKHREPFRPFAPSILSEEKEKWFAINKPTPAAEYMLMAYPAHEERRDKIPAVLHVDGTGRIQSVRQQSNPKYHKLISEFHQRTGIPIVLNTSFNDSEPIVCTPADALNTFVNTKIDYLAIGSFLLDRCHQSENGNEKQS